MQCQRRREWIFEPDALETAKVAVTDRCSLSEDLVSPQDTKITCTIRHEEYFVCPRCGWKQSISKRGIISTQRNQ